LNGSYGEIFVSAPMVRDPGGTSLPVPCAWRSGDLGAGWGAGA
jgi:hypothetical protein